MADYPRFGSELCDGVRESAPNVDPAITDYRAVFQAAKSWKPDATEWRVALVAFVLSLVARWVALLPGYSPDDYLIIQVDHPSFDFAVKQGRELEYVLKQLFIRLDVLPPHSGTMGAFLLSAVLVAMGLVVCRLWGIRDRSPESLIAVCLIVLYPYQAEHFTFRMTTLLLAIALTQAFAALLLCTKSRAWWLLSWLLFVGSLLVYQGALNYAVMALLFSAVFHLAGAAEENPRFGETLRSQLGVVFAGIIAYAAFKAFISKLTGFAMESRGRLIPVDEIPQRARLAATQIVNIFFRGEPYLPLLTKLLLICSVIAAIGVTLVAKRKKEEYSPSRPGRILLAAALILLVGVPLCLGVILALQEWWPTPRLLVQTGIFWAGVFALTYRLASIIGRRILIAGATVIIFSFMGINNHIFSDQERGNLRDLATANRIVGHIESRPDFADIRGVVLSGGYWGFASPLETVEGDTNISALVVPWSKNAVLDEVSGYNFRIPPPEVAARADSYCKNAAKWPDPQSIAKMDAYAVVCLPTGPTVR